MSGQRKALIVASDQYEQEGLRNLVAPAADAEALAGVLGDPQIGDFDVQVVRNEPSHVIQAQVEDLLSESRPDDVLLLHFSCHGLKSDSGELFFAAANTRPNRLGSTAVSADFVQRCMRASRSRSIVLLLDCCYGGAFAQGVTVRAAGDVNVLDSFPTDRAGSGRGRAVITASTAMEYAFEGEQLADDQGRRPSLFTAALTEGLITGDADRDEDGWVSLNELYEYVFDAVRDRNPHQTPSRQVDMQGELYLARSQRRRIQAAPLPADLQAAMTDQNLYTRLGAVSELQVRLNGANLAAAAGAYAALAGLANDIRYVAEPAAAAVAAAAVRPDPDHVTFGPAGPGTTVPAQRVRLAGPPIARACTLRPSEDWIHCTLAEDGFDVAADASDLGQFHATIDIKGPTGRATVTITLDVASPATSPPSSAPAPAPTPSPVTIPSPTTPDPAPTPAPATPSAPTPEATAQPDTTPEPETAPTPALVPAAGTATTAAPAPAPPRTPQPSRLSRLAHRLAVRDRLRRWWRGPDRPYARAAGAVVLAVLLALEALHLQVTDATQYPAIHRPYWWTVFALALAALVITAFELPVRWPTTVLHLLNSVYFVVLPLVLLHLKSEYYDPGSDGPSALLGGTMVGGTVAYGLAALGCAVAVLRRARDAVTITGLVTSVLMTVGAALIVATEAGKPSFLSGPGCDILLAAGVSSLVMAGVLLKGWIRPRRSADR
jgi:Caspase domain